MWNEETLFDLGLGLTYVILAFLVILIAKMIKDWMTPFRIDEQLTRKDNPALGLAVTGYFAGVIIVLLGATTGPDPAVEPTTMELATGLGIDLAYAVGGIVALNLGRIIVDKLVLRKFSTVKEIIEDRNVGTGAVEFGAYVSTALVVAGSIHGEGTVLSALGFFALGQLVLVIFGFIYQAMTRYDIHDEIEKDNVAAGVALGSSLIAMGIILLRATGGDFISWNENLIGFSLSAVLGFMLLTVLRKATDWVLLPGTTLALEIARDRNLNAAWIEGIISIGMAAVIFTML